MLIILSWTAGSVDALSYLGLGHIFTANMTGNAVLLGLALSQGEFLKALHSITAIGGFVLGVAIGAAMVLEPNNREWSQVLTRALTIEAAALGVSTLLFFAHADLSTSGSIYFLISLLGAAMGIQSATIEYLHIPGVSTVYLTGTLTKLISGLVGRISTRMASAFKKSEFDMATTDNPFKKSNLKLQSTIYITYILAAMVCGYVELRSLQLTSLLPLIGVVLVVCLCTLIMKCRQK